MATIYYNIDSGTPDFTASINPAVAVDNIHSSLGQYYFTNIPDGEYSITIVDSVGCQAIFDASIYCSTTTTTTGIPTTTTTTLPPTTTTTTLAPTTTTTTTTVCCPYVSNFSTGGFQMAHALINDGTYLYVGERINNATPSSVARIIKYNTNLTEVGSYEVGANKDVENMCYDSVNNRIYATQVYDDGVARRMSILVINPSTMLPVSQTNYTTLITGESFPIVTDGTYIYGATYSAPPVIFKIRISDMALVSTVTWTGRERAHAARIDTRYGYMYLTDIPYSEGTNPYFAKVRLSSLVYTEVSIGAYVRKATDDFAMIDTGSDIYCYIGGEYVYTSGGNAGYGGVQVRVSDLSLTGIAMKPSYAVCEYGDEIYSATIDGNMQIFSRTDLNNVLTCNLSGFYPNELNVLGNRLFGANFNGYNETEGKMLEFNLCYYFPTTTTTSTTLVPPTTTTTTTLPPTTTTTTTLPPTTTSTTTLLPTTTTTTTLPLTTTTTTTTIPVNFDINYTCGSGNRASITISNFSGGSGSYQTNPSVVFSSEQDALTNNYWDEAWDGQTYLAINNGTWWVPLRDANNHNNIIAKFVTFNCFAPTTTTTTLFLTTTTTSTTSAPTTTTTTTLPPTTTTTTTAEPICYLSSVSYVRQESISTQTSFGRGIFFKSDGTRLFLIGDDNNEVYQYNLSTAWNISTMSYNSSYSLNTGNLRGIYFKSDGLKMYVTNGATVDQYTLSSAWDISGTVTYNGSTSVASQTNSAYGVWFKSDGTKMIVTGYDGTNAEVISYNLSTAWDITGTVTYSNRHDNTSVVVFGDLVFNSDGTRMWVVLTYSRVWEYTLSTAWDVSTLSYNCHYDTNELFNSFGLYIDSGLNKLYISESNSDIIREYNM